ncbi:hypothetical protein LMG918_08790 [Xanthomonas euvesicatoria]|nr:hypothetical protein LMG918_08790 [Xanthomonas euvesicatoria]
MGWTCISINVLAMRPFSLPKLTGKGKKSFFLAVVRLVTAGHFLRPGSLNELILGMSSDMGKTSKFCLPLAFSLFHLNTEYGRCVDLTATAAYAWYVIDVFIKEKKKTSSVVALSM